MALTRGGVQPRPQNLTSYQNPYVFAASAYGGAAVGESVLAMVAAAAMAGSTCPAPPYMGGNVPMTLAALAAAAL